MELTKSALKAKVDEGLKRKALAELYGVSELEMGRYLRFFGLKIKKSRGKKEPKYTLVDDTVITEQPSVITEGVKV